MKTTMEKAWHHRVYKAAPASATIIPLGGSCSEPAKGPPDWRARAYCTHAQAWVKSFAIGITDEHLHSAIRFVTPAHEPRWHDAQRWQTRHALCKMTRGAKPGS